MLNEEVENWFKNSMLKWWLRPWEAHTCAKLKNREEIAKSSEHQIFQTLYHPAIKERKLEQSDAN